MTRPIGFSLTALLVLLTISTGCQTKLAPEVISQESLGYPQPPEIELLYYPYSVSLDREITDPHPMFAGWTDIRMRFDTRRIARTGIDLLVIDVEPKASLESPERLVQYRRFARYADQANLPFSLQADASDLTRAELIGFLNWVVQLNLHTSDMARKQANRPELRLLDAPASLQEVSHVGLSIVHESWQTRTSWAELPYLEHAKINRAGDAILVYAALAPQSSPQPPHSADWPLPRRGGKSLRQAVATAISLTPRRLVIASWNNFTNGSFIQPNMLDQSRLEEALRKAVATAKNQQN